MLQVGTPVQNKGWQACYIFNAQKVKMGSYCRPPFCHSHMRTDTHIETLAIRRLLSLSLNNICPRHQHKQGVCGVYHKQRQAQREDQSCVLGLSVLWKLSFCRFFLFIYFFIYISPGVLLPFVACVSIRLRWMFAVCLLAAHLSIFTHLLPVCWALAFLWITMSRRNISEHFFFQ